MSNYEIYLNTPDPKVVAERINNYPFAGVTCNSQMIASLKRPDFFNVLHELRQATGDRKLFIQTPSNDYEGMMRDVEVILREAGDNTYIKVPTNADGIHAIMDLSAQGVNMCGTQVMSTLQGISALQAGAKYIAVFYCFMGMGGADENGLYGGVDAKAVYRAINKYIEVSGCQGRMMACAPRTPDEMSYLVESGAPAIILDPIDFDNCFSARHFQALHKDVRNSWEEVYGKTNIWEMK